MVWHLGIGGEAEGRIWLRGSGKIHCVKRGVGMRTIGGGGGGKVGRLSRRRRGAN